VKTRVLAANSGAELDAVVVAAVESLRAGDAIALPTETVYGLAADALGVNAVMKIFEAKERPRFDPLIVHLPERDWLERITNVSRSERELVDTLTDAFWPGPLTLILPRQPVVPELVTGGLETVAVRVSAHPIFQRIVRDFGGPLAAPSANRFGRISPTTAEHVRAELDGRIPLIIDGGPAIHGLESTIVAVRHGGMEILRHGPITAEQLASFGEIRRARVTARPEAPGQLRAHYAPRTPLVLTSSPASFQAPSGQRVGALVLQKVENQVFGEARILSASGDLREAATNLFRCLRELDQAGLDLIVAEELPETGLGTAIMERLRRAAAK
jgi:L-threonylcarbamoyladenylate synthase